MMYPRREKEKISPIENGLSGVSADIMGTDTAIGAVMSPKMKLSERGIAALRIVQGTAVPCVRSAIMPGRFEA